jgi:hypothetical protein
MHESFMFSIAQHTDGGMSFAAPEVPVPELGAIDVSESAFEMIPTILTLRLYRVDAETGEPRLVQTWTRKEVQV